MVFEARELSEQILDRGIVVHHVDNLGDAGLANGGDSVLCHVVFGSQR